MTDQFPLDKEDFLRTTALFLAEEGARSEVRLVASAPCDIQAWNYDGWDGGQWTWKFHFSVPMRMYMMIGDAERQAICARIAKAMDRVLEIVERHSVEEVRLAPEIQKAEADWREKAARWATGEGTSNQGRARSDNLAPLEKDGLLFRSHAEINLFTAFKTLGIAVAPLPVFIRGGASFRRIEPDFVLIYAGKMMVVEVDGDAFHHETPARAHERLTMLSHEGVQTERVSASACDTPEKATACASNIFSVLKRMAEIK